MLYRVSCFDFLDFVFVMSTSCVKSRAHKEKGFRKKERDYLERLEKYQQMASDDNIKWQDVVAYNTQNLVFVWVGTRC